MARARSLPRYRRSPFLVIYWRAGALLVHNYATGGVATVPPRTAELLDFFADWHTASEFADRTAVPLPAVRRLLKTMANASLLQSSDAPRSVREKAMARWEAWNPAAGFFHTATRDVRFIDPVEGQRALRRKAQTVALPARVKRYRDAWSRDLPRVRAVGEFPRVLLSRRTWRQFARSPITLDALATLLGLTGGIHQWAAVRGQGDFPFKTSPSGGARHPIEIYVWARRVNGLAPGLYHYRADRHSLERLRAHRRPVSVKRYMPTQSWYEGAAAIVFFSSVYARYQWKYTYARAYRATLIEAGHQCQTFCLVATWLGLAPFCTMALADSQIERDLGLDGVSESVLYAAGVGVRPRGDAVRSKPAGSPPLRMRPNRRVVDPSPNSRSS